MNKFEERFQREMFEERFKKETAQQPEPQKKESTIEDYKFSHLNMVKNAPQSMGNLAGDLVNAVVHPKDTWNAMKSVGIGGYEKFTPGIQPEEKIIDAIGEDYNKAYGSEDYPEEGIDNFQDYMRWKNKRLLKTLEQDPARVLSDASMFFGGGSSMIPGKTAKTAQKFAMAIDPINATINAGKIGAKKLLNTKYFKESPANAIKRSAKFSTVLDKGINKNKRTELANTIIKHQLPFDHTGLNKTTDLITDLSNDVENIVDAWTASGKKLPVNNIKRQAIKQQRKIGKVMETSDPINDVARSQEVLRKWEEPTKGRTMATPRELQNLKKELYTKANYNTIQDVENIPVDSTRKAMANAAKLELEKMAPEIKGMNKELGSLLDLYDPFQQSINRIQNRDFLGIGVPIKMVAGESMFEGGGGLVGLLSGLLDAPTNQAALGLKLGKIQNSPISGLLTDNSLTGLFLRKALIEAEKTNARE